ncbi:MAG: ABC transporter ATP-binding protein [Acidimicrobiales bacterium]
MASVTFDAVSKRYGDVTAVDTLDLAIEDGEFMVLLGPSGCGKTTALRMIAGLEDISDGKLLLGDEVVNEVDPAHRDISMVFQSYALYPHMTVRRNIESPLLVRKYEVDGPGTGARKLPAVDGDERVAEAACARPRALPGPQARLPVASASAPPWPGRSSGGPRRSSWTSRSPTWTPSSGPRPASSSSSCTSGSAPPSSTSPTTRSRP